jgi:2-amino-4-hydroxy-6-hydroxymethyldihydropteridine diphosphokinase
MTATTALIALGSNRPHGRHGAPARVIGAALAALVEAGVVLDAVSGIHRTRAVGPAGRDFANAVAAVRTMLPPTDLLALLKRTERAFGRRRGRRWGARVLDLDIIAYGEAAWPDSRAWRRRNGRLVIPHPRMQERDFVLEPLVEIAPDWRHPVLGLSARTLLERLRRNRRLTGSGPLHMFPRSHTKGP